MHPLHRGGKLAALSVLHVLNSRIRKRESDGDPSIVQATRNLGDFSANLSSGLGGASEEGMTTKASEGGPLRASRVRG